MLLLGWSVAEPDTALVASRYGSCHQCKGAGSIPGMVGGKTFALVSDPILYRTDHRGFFSGYSGFPPPLKTVIVTALKISQNTSDFLSGPENS